MITQDALRTYLKTRLIDQVTAATFIDSESVSALDDAGDAGNQEALGIEPDEIKPVMSLFDGTYSYQPLTAQGTQGTFFFDVLLYLVGVPSNMSEIDSDALRLLMATAETQVMQWLQAEGGCIVPSTGLDNPFWHDMRQANDTQNEQVRTLAQQLFAAKNIPLVITSSR